MSNFFELMGLSSDDLADSLADQIVQVTWVVQATDMHGLRTPASKRLCSLMLRSTLSPVMASCA